MRPYDSFFCWRNGVERSGAGFPQIPRMVWWQVRELLKQKPQIRLDEQILAAELAVQVAAARQYLAELKRVKLLTDEGGPTDLARQWRLEDSYRDATAEILKECYPQSLIDMAPPGSADRGKVETWFLNQGLGSGTARNKAATYVMIANDDPPPSGELKASGPRRSGAKREARSEPPRRSSPPAAKPPAYSKQDPIPFNLNLQIHISADASSEQIETIFASMRRYLHDDFDHQ